MLCGLPSRVTRPLHLQDLKTRSNRDETLRFEPQPHQSGDWRSRENVFFLGDILFPILRLKPSGNV
jgi:hypothetical protein